MERALCLFLVEPPRCGCGVRSILENRGCCFFSLVFFFFFFSTIFLFGVSPLHQPRHPRSPVQLTRHHAGFVRLALEHALASGNKRMRLVPVYSPGENAVLSNVRMPEMQRRFEKRLGFPFPYFPWGRWGLPIPRRVRLAMYVGEPVDVAVRNTRETFEGAVERISKLYYESLGRAADRAVADGGGAYAWVAEDPKAARERRRRRAERRPHSDSGVSD
jgi:hypothetical protein